MAGLSDAELIAAYNGQPICKTENDEDTKDRGAPRRYFKHPQAAQNSLLLTVAPKIRNMIYKLCLTHPEDIGEKLKLKKKFECFTVEAHYPRGVARPKIQEAYEQSISKATKRAIKQHSFRNLAVMRTCQAMYNDSAQVFWGQRLTFRSIVQLQNFLLTPIMRHDLVRDVKVLKMDYNMGVNCMPGICVLMADKLTGLEAFDIDMSNMRQEIPILLSVQVLGFQDDEHVKKAAKNLGFGIYSCMHPWVTEVVRKQGIDGLMSILQIVRETGSADPAGAVSALGTSRVFWDFCRRGPLTTEQREMADIVTGNEILRQIGIYKKDFGFH